MLEEYIRIIEEIEKINWLLSNERFLLKASADVIALNKKKLSDYEIKINALVSNCKELLLQYCEVNFETDVTREERLSWYIFYFWELKYIEGLKTSNEFNEEWFLNEFYSDQYRRVCIDLDIKNTEYLEYYDYLKKERII